MPAEDKSSKLNTITENYLLLNVVWYILLSAATVFVMWYYSEKNLPWHIRISVFIALGASLSIVIMVPWDVSNVYQQRCQNATAALIDGKEPTCPAEISTITKVHRRVRPSRALCLSSLFATGVAKSHLRISLRVVERRFLYHQRTGMVLVASAASIQ